MRYKKIVIRLIIFILIGVLGTLYINHILLDKAARGLKSLRFEERNSFNVIFYGNSHAYNGFIATDLYDDYGIKSYNMSMESQSLPLVYYTIKDSLKYQKPQVAVVDLFAATSVSNDFDLMHYTVDSLSFSTRIQAVKEFVPKEKRLEYAFPLIAYHDRWLEVKKQDFLPMSKIFSPNKNPEKGGEMSDDCVPCNYPSEVVQCANSEEVGSIDEDWMYWLERIEKLCDDNQVELLFVVIPYELPFDGQVSTAVGQMLFFNAIEAWCNQENIDYLNLFRNLEEMSFDFSTDMKDVNHVNVCGAKKITAYVGEYINSNYSILDKREN